MILSYFFTIIHAGHKYHRKYLQWELHYAWITVKSILGTNHFIFFGVVFPSRMNPPIKGRSETNPSNFLHKFHLAPKPINRTFVGQHLILAKDMKLSTFEAHAVDSQFKDKISFFKVFGRIGCVINSSYFCFGFNIEYFLNNLFLDLYVVYPNLESLNLIISIF